MEERPRFSGRLFLLNQADNPRSLILSDSVRKRGVADTTSLFHYSTGFHQLPIRCQKEDVSGGFNGVGASFAGKWSVQ